MKVWPDFSYARETFTSFIAESYKANHATSKPTDYYAWMDASLRRPDVRARLTELGTTTPAWSGRDWDTILNSERDALTSVRNVAMRTQQEVAFSAGVHRIIKTIIPHFSLDRGFEFANVVRYGERQCFLQSVLIAGLLQRVGMTAGVVMVYKNPKGKSSNNGHAVTVARYADGTARVVDASEMFPFDTPRGIFLADERSGYRYVNPRYRSDKERLFTQVNREGDGKTIALADLCTLDIPFLRSQFEYYRGEREPGGPLAPKPTRDGLERAAKHLETSVALCAHNPLAVYYLGRVYHRLEKGEAAQKQYLAAWKLYDRFGWVAPGEREVLAKRK